MTSRLPLTNPLVFVYYLLTYGALCPLSVVFSPFPVLVVWLVFNLVFGLAIWKRKLWGIYGYVLLTVMSLPLTGMIGLIGLIILIWLTRRVWNQME